MFDELDKIFVIQHYNLQFISKFDKNIEKIIKLFHFLCLYNQNNIKYLIQQKRLKLTVDILNYKYTCSFLLKVNERYIYVLKVQALLRNKNYKPS
jgi:hypothetical protein